MAQWLRMHRSASATGSGLPARGAVSANCWPPLGLICVPAQMWSVPAQMWSVPAQMWSVPAQMWSAVGIPFVAQRSRTRLAGTVKCRPPNPLAESLRGLHCHASYLGVTRSRGIPPHAIRTRWELSESSHAASVHSGMRINFGRGYWAASESGESHVPP